MGKRKYFLRPTIGLALMSTEKYFKAIKYCMKYRRDPNYGCLINGNVFKRYLISVQFPNSRNILQYDVLSVRCLSLYGIRNLCHSMNRWLLSFKNPTCLVSYLVFRSPQVKKKLNAFKYYTDDSKLVTFSHSTNLQINSLCLFFEFKAYLILTVYASPLEYKST